MRNRGGRDAGAGERRGQHVDAIYGLMLIGWSLGGVIGPIAISALLGGGEEPSFTLAYTTLGILALVSVALTFLTRVPEGADGRPGALSRHVSGSTVT